MLQFMRGPVLGVFTFSLLVINTLLLGVLLYIAIFIKFIVPQQGWRNRMTVLVEWVSRQWMVNNLNLSKWLLGINWKIDIPPEVNRQGNYLVIANHQSWVDILATFQAFIRCTPFFKIFLKKELLYIPIVGQAWWGLDFPAMKRHSREQIKANPALADEDLATTKRMCERYRGRPAAIQLYPEGTRVTAAKQAKQNSPFTNMLKPKSGGMAFALAAMEGQIDELIDVTIFYPQGVQELWAYLCGYITEIEVSATIHTIPDSIRYGDYSNDTEYRQHFQAWLNEIWQRKDAQLTARLQQQAVAES